MRALKCPDAQTTRMNDTTYFLITAGGKITCLRCTAMSKTTREQCRKPALKVSKTQKCQFHGGRGSGPRTAEGKARIRAAHLVHGNETKAFRRERSQRAAELLQLEDVMHVARMTSAARTPGRKPTGYQRISTVAEARTLMISQVLNWDKGPGEGK